MSDRKKLLPCPFCGGDVSVALGGDEADVHYFITRGYGKNACKCRVFMEGEKFDKVSESEVYARHKAELIEAWNRRPADTRISELLSDIEEFCKDQRERHIDDSVCGLCEYDADHGLDGYANECPGFEGSDCFRMRESYKRRFLDEVRANG